MESPSRKYSSPALKRRTVLSTAAPGSSKLNKIGMTRRGGESDGQQIRARLALFPLFSARGVHPFRILVAQKIAVPGDDLGRWSPKPKDEKIEKDPLAVNECIGCVKKSRSAWTRRVPWGDPDLQGLWNNSTITPL